MKIKRFEVKLIIFSCLGDFLKIPEKKIKGNYEQGLFARKDPGYLLWNSTYFFIPPNLLKTWMVYIYDSSDDHRSMIIRHSSERARHNPICLFFTI